MNAYLTTLNNLQKTVLISHLLHLYIIRSETTIGLHWKVKTNPIVFTKNVTLQCSSPDCCNNKTVRQWTGGRYKNSLSYNEGPYDKSKYSAKLEKDSFSLTILDFDVKDANTDYTCVYGFDQTTHVLMLSDDNYVILPTNETTEDDFQVLGRNITAEIMFKKVYPTPVCLLKLDNKNLPAVPKYQFEKESFFYKGSVSFLYQVDQSECGEILTVSCNVSALPIETTKRNVSLNRCKEVTNNEDPSTNTWIIPVVILVIIGLLIAGVVGIRWFRKGGNSIKDCCKKKYEATENHVI